VGPEVGILLMSLQAADGHKGRPDSLLNRHTLLRHRSQVPVHLDSFLAYVDAPQGARPYQSSIMQISLHDYCSTHATTAMHSWPTSLAELRP
jgi:hypothetical protein